MVATGRPVARASSLTPLASPGSARASSSSSARSTDWTPSPARCGFPAPFGCPAPGHLAPRHALGHEAGLPFLRYGMMFPKASQRPAALVQSFQLEVLGGDQPTHGSTGGTGACDMVVGKVTVNGQGTSITDVPLHTTALDFLRECGLTGCKEGCAEGECGACSVLVARPGLTTPTEWVAVNACLVPDRLARRPGDRHRRGLGAPARCTPCSRRWRSAGARSAATARRASSAAWPPSTTGPTAAPAGRDATPGARPRARPERLRPARAEREPLPLHRLPPDPRRRLRARRPAGRRLASPRGERPAARARPRPGCGHDGRTFVRPRRSPTRCGCCASDPDAIRRRRLHRLGCRGQPPRHAGRVGHRDRPPARAARPGRRGRPDRDRRRADADRDRAPPRRHGAAAGPAVPAVRLAAHPQRRDARRQPRHRLADRRRAAGAARPGGEPWCWPASTASARSPWPTTSPATGRACAAPTS